MTTPGVWLTMAVLAAAPAKAPIPAAGGRVDAGAVDGGAVGSPAGPEATLSQAWSDGTLRGPVLVIAFSADGTRVAVGSGDKLVRIYDAKTGKVLQEFKGANTAVQAVAFSPDGKLLAFGEGAMAVRLFQLETGKLAREFPHPDSVSGLAFSPDGALLAVSGHTSTGYVYTVADGKRAWEYQGRSAAFSADGKQLLTAVAAGALRQWDVATGKRVGELKTAPHQPWMSASADLAAVVSWNPTDKVVHLWNGAANKPLGELKGHEKGVSSAAVSADGLHAVSASDDHTLRLWDVRGLRSAGHTAIELTGFVALSNDGQKLAVSQGNRLTLYTVAW